MTPGRYCRATDRCCPTQNCAHTCRSITSCARTRWSVAIRTAVPADRDGTAVLRRSRTSTCGLVPEAGPRSRGSDTRRTATADFEGRRPVVAVLDTGAGEHRWLPDEIVQRGLEVNGVPVGYTDPATEPERSGVLSDPYEGLLDSDSGHGTFIAGLIRQALPRRGHPRDPGHGQRRCRRRKRPARRAEASRLTCRTAGAGGRWTPQLVDVVSLSLGYYHEQPEDLAFDPQLLRAAAALGSACGVAVVVRRRQRRAPTGRCSPRPSPASGRPGHRVRPRLPCRSSASVRCNPDGTVAMFSNAGPWVACHRARVLRSSARSRRLRRRPGGRLRPGRLGATAGARRIDPDDFTRRLRHLERDLVRRADPGRGDRADACSTASCGPIDPPDARRRDGPGLERGHRLHRAVTRP